MKRLTWALALVFPAFLIAQQVPPGTKVAIARWPEDRVAAISLTFDDGLNTHVDVVGPTLKRHHLHGTFFVATGLGPWEKRQPEWGLLAEQGNELGSHTVHHPCLLEEIEPHSQNYTPEMMEAEVRESAESVAQVAHNTRGVTFAYPCDDLSFGPPREQARNSALYLRYVSEYAFGARDGGPGAPQDPDDLSILTIGDLGPTEGKDFAALLAVTAPVIRQGQWGVFCFHGVGGDYLTITAETLDELAGYLEKHSEIWTATFGDVLRYTLERKAASMKLSDNPDHSTDIALEWPLEPKTFDLPLTLRVEGAGEWRDIVATGDGKILDVRQSKDRAKTIFVDVVPQTRLVHIDRKSR